MHMCLLTFKRLEHDILSLESGMIKEWLLFSDAEVLLSSLKDI